MGTMTIRVINRSTHEFRLAGTWGSEITAFKDKDGKGISIPRKGTVDIGTIDIPHMLKNRDGNWGWWYIEDSTNSAPSNSSPTHIPKSTAAMRPTPVCSPTAATKGITRWAPRRTRCPDTWIPRGTTPRSHSSSRRNGRPARRTGFSITAITFLDLPLRDAAAHAYVQAVSFKDRKKTVDFECYGGTSGRENRYPALSFIASEDQLRLARTICCFDPADK